MAKTAAERQKQYRERRKKLDPDYLKRERERAKQYRKPIESLPVKEQKFRRQRNKYYALTFREKMRRQRKTEVNFTVDSTEKTSSCISDSTISSTSSTVIEEPRTSRSTPGPILVKMSFPNKKRESKALTKARDKIKNLQKSAQTLKRNESKWKKKYQRMKSKLDRVCGDRNLHNNSVEDLGVSITDNELTPSSKTKAELKTMRASPSTRKLVKKKLLLTNVLIEEVRCARRQNNDKRRKQILSKIVSGNILKRYRCKSALKFHTGIKTKTDCSKMVDFSERRRLRRKREELKKKVIDFLVRDDVSIQLPGKKDVTKHNKETYQTRVLSDYLINIYEKFHTEHPTTQISFSLFCRLRPAYVKLTSCISRNTCLCTKHQNVSMKLKCLRSNGVNVTQNAEAAGKSVTKEDMESLVEQLPNDKALEYTEWKRVEESGKKKMKIVKIIKSKTEFTEIMLKEFDQFLQHVGRVKAQYLALRELKMNLPTTDLVIQMDFAENFTCFAMDEIQSAYFNATTVTLHPIVLYFKNETSEVDHKNFIFVSDANHHNAAAVLTILDKFMPDVKAMFPDAKTIHFWTDSPSSQYRNKYIFHALTQFEKLYGFQARWNYFEAGHGKGPCDGLGGVAKRQAAEAIKQGKACIQDARDFFTWAKDNQKTINYKFYSSQDYESTSDRIMQTKLKPIPGTMKLHAVFLKEANIYSAETSCYCPGCLTGLEGVVCETTWTVAKRIEDYEKESDNIETHKECEENTQRKTEPELALDTEDLNQFVAALYENRWYIGKIKDIDMEDNTVHITFMKETNTKQSVLFQWPSKEDSLWLTVGEVLCRISEPVATGKRQRLFKIPESDLELIESAFNRKA